MATRLMIGRLLLCFLFPAIISLNVSATGSPEESMPWLRYWVVLSIALILELLLEKIEGTAFTIVKLVFVAWCLAPVEFNGTDLVFQYVLLPLHHGVQYLGTETSAIMLPHIIKGKECVENVVEIVTNDVLHPLHAILLKWASGALTCGISFFVGSYQFIGDMTNIWFQNMLPPINCAIAIFHKIAMEITGYGWMALEKIVEIIEESPELATTFFYYCLDLATAFFTSSHELSSVAAGHLAEFTILSFERIVEFLILAFEKSVEWSTKGGESIVSTLEDGVTFYKDNQKNPRLFF